MATLVRNRLTAKAVTGRLGAMVEQVDLSRVDRPMADDLMALLVEHKVLFFRDQNLDRQQHLSLARQFGELEIHPLTTDEAFLTDTAADPAVIIIESNAHHPSAASAWHSDVTWRAQPSIGSILRCIACPSAGGDTLWADMEAIYDDLDDDTKARLSGLTATHDWHPFRKMMERAGDLARLARLEAEYPAQVHPVVRTHPVSGRKCIYVNGAFTVRINELDDEEGRALLTRLYALPFRPEYNVRFRWEPGSVAFWDNRSTQHYVSKDFFPQHRLLERITIAGTERPF